MRNLDIYRIFLSFLLSTPILAEPHIPTPKSFPPSLDALLIDPGPSPAPTSPVAPILKHLDLRQVAAPAAAQPAAANPNAAGANAPAAPAANPNAPAKPAAAPAAAAPAPAAAAPAPAVGVGGAGAAPAAAQPAPGAQANPVTTIQVETVVGGVTKTVPKVYTQTFAVPVSAPPVLTGSIGMGTLTGKVGVVKTADAKKSDGGVGRREVPWMEIGGLVVAGMAAVVGGGGVVGVGWI